jgi:hypothetical protein
MATTISGSLSAKLQAIFTGDSGFYSGTGRDIAKTLGLAIAAGTGADQCDRCGLIYKALSSSTPDTIDLKSLTDPNGVAFTDLARVRLLWLWNESTTDAASVAVGPDTTNGWTNGINANANGEGVILRGSTASSSGMLILVAPATTGLVVASNNKVIRLTPSAHAQTIRGIVLGCSA